MLKINTIGQFLELPYDYREEILKSIKGKDRLDDFLREQTKTKDQEKPIAHWEECKSCKPYGYPGWKWVEEHQRDDSDIHPSQIDKCIKFLVLSCSGFAAQMERFIEPRLQQLFDLGSAWHLVMQRYGKRGAWGKPDNYHPEAPIDPDALTHDGNPVHTIATHYWIKGHVDAVLDDYEVNVPSIGDVSIRLVHEYKTINSNGYSRLTRPHMAHKRQATIYSAVFDIPIVVYFYTNKDDNKMADFPVPFDHTIWTEIAAKCALVQSYVNQDKVPAWEDTSAIKNPSECMDCGFRKICQPPVKKSGR